MIKTLSATVAVALLVSGCTTIQMAGQITDRVCQSSEAERLLLRERVSDAVHPHSLVLYCEEEME